METINAMCRLFWRFSIAPALFGTYVAVDAAINDTLGWGYLAAGTILLWFLLFSIATKVR